MMNDLLFAAQFLVFIGCAGLAFTAGGIAEKRSITWVVGNFVISTAILASGWNSPTAHLVLDGVYAVGLLPFAMIYVSWWIGVLTLLAAAAFSLEAGYLIQDLPFDRFYWICNNIINLGAAPVMLACGLAHLSRRRKRSRDDFPAGALPTT